MPLRIAPFLLCVSVTAFGQVVPQESASELPDDPSVTLYRNASSSQEPGWSSSRETREGETYRPMVAEFKLVDLPGLQAGQAKTPADTDKPVQNDHQQPKRILGIMPNFRSVSAGVAPHPPGWKYNFTVATHQAFDYSSFIFLGLTSITAEGMNTHPALGKGVGGFYAYTWRGFVDKTDNTYLSAWLLPSLLHEDTRYYGLGHGSILHRSLYVISRQAVARTYGGRDTPNIAGLGGKVLTQVISRQYYPSSATDFSTLATKFAYSVMRDVAFTSIREFYPDIAAHYIRKHREKLLREQQKTP